MTSLPFQELTQRLEEELYRLHYTEASIIQYRRMWKRIAIFLEQEGTKHFTERQGCAFWMNNSTFLSWRKPGS